MFWTKANPKAFWSRPCDACKCVCAGGHTERHTRNETREMCSCWGYKQQTTGMTAGTTIGHTIGLTRTGRNRWKTVKQDCAQNHHEFMIDSGSHSKACNPLFAPEFSVDDSEKARLREIQDQEIQVHGKMWAFDSWAMRQKVSYAAA